MRVSQVLCAKGINKAFGGNKVLRGVDLEAHPGRVTALIGPNGAGKSTLANILNGFETPDAGTVLLGDVNITTVPPHRRAELGLGRTFQNLELFPQLTVLDNVMMGAYCRYRAGFLDALLGLSPGRREEKEAAELAMTILEDLGLADLAHRRVGSLGFGQAKLVELARVMAMEPAVLVMDEPAAGLTAQDADAMGEHIVRWAKKGVTVLLIEHNMKLVMSISDWVVVLDQGQVIASGTPAEVQGNERVIDAYLGGGDLMENVLLGFREER